MRSINTSHSLGWLKKGRQAARDIFILMIDASFRINEASVLKWSDVDFDNSVIYLYRSKVSNDDFIPMSNRLRTTLLNRRKSVDGDYVFPGRYGGHKTIQNNRALEAAFRRAGLDDVSSHNLRKTFATRLLSRGAAITDVQHLLGHASVKTTEKAYAAFVKNERFKQTNDLLDKPVVPKLKVVRWSLHRLLVPHCDPIPEDTKYPKLPILLNILRRPACR